MIELSPVTAMTAYLTLLLLLITAVWLYSILKRQKKSLDITDEELTTCEYCQIVYLSKKFKRYTHCPQCKSMNDKKSLDRS